MNRHFPSFIITLFLVPLSLATVAALALSNNLFDPQFYKSTLKEADTYNQALEIAPAIIYDQLVKENKIAAGALPKEEVAAAIKNTVSAQWLETNANRVIDEIVGYINGANASVELVIDTKELKVKARENLDALLKKYYNGLPVCTAAEILDFQIRTRRGENPTANCRNPGVGADAALRDFDADADNFFKQIPDKVDIGAELRKKQRELDLARVAASRARQGANTAVVVCLILLGIIALINKNDKKMMLGWLAAPLATCSLLSLANMVAIKTRLINAVHVSGMPAEARVLVVNILQKGLDRLFAGVRTIDIVLLVASGVLIAMAWSVAKEEKPTENKV